MIYKFKGWSYDELAKCFKLKIVQDNIGASDEYGKKTVEAIRRYLRNRVDSGNTKEASSKVRQFIKAMLKHKGIDYYAPVWKGMLEIEDDDSLLKVTVEILPLMWT